MRLSLRAGVAALMLAALCAAPSLRSVVAAAADSPVADAAVRGDVAAVRGLLERGADVQTARPDGMTALHWAAMRSDVEMAEMLLYAGANIEATTRIGQHTPLHVAGRSGQAEVVQALLEAGADPHAASSSGATPLHLAAQAGNAAAVAALLDHGADVNARERTWGQTPLMFAAASNRLGPVNVLMERGADLEVATRVVDLPALDSMDRAAAARRKQVLDGFRAAAPPDERQGWRPTASEVQAAVRAAREVQRFDDVPDVADGVQLERGTPRAYTERVGVQGGLTALLHAARQGHTEVAMALLYAGADIDRVSGDNTSPLQIATMNGHFDLALRLIERGADPNVATGGGATPLFAALNLQWAPRARYPQPRAHDQQEATYLDVMGALLEAGADPNVRLAKHLWYMSYNHCGSGERVTGRPRSWRAAYSDRRPGHEALRAHGADPHVPTRAPEPRRRTASAPRAAAGHRRACRRWRGRRRGCGRSTPRRGSATARASSPTPTGTCPTAGCPRSSTWSKRSASTSTPGTTRATPRSTMPRPAATPSSCAISSSRAPTSWWSAAAARPPRTWRTARTSGPCRSPRRWPCWRASEPSTTTTACPADGVSGSTSRS